MERRDGRALRPREAAQAVAVEPEVHQDTDISSAVLVVALLGYEPPERRAGHVGVKLPPIQSMLGGVRGPVCYDLIYWGVSYTHRVPIKAAPAGMRHGLKGRNYA